MGLLLDYEPSDGPLTLTPVSRDGAVTELSPRYTQHYTLHLSRARHDASMRTISGRGAGSGSVHPANNKQHSWADCWDCSTVLLLHKPEIYPEWKTSHRETSLNKQT